VGGRRSREFKGCIFIYYFVFVVLFKDFKEMESEGLFVVPERIRRASNRQRSFPEVLTFVQEELELPIHRKLSFGGNKLEKGTSFGSRVALHQEQSGVR
jgi:hypothetical protein